MQQPTWKPCKRELNDRLSTAEIDSLPRSCFAFPDARKEPMTDASHVRNALARFNQVHDASDFDRDLAFANIQEAARHFGISVRETNWRQLGARRKDSSASSEQM
jgi:hypothetical protein